MKRNVCFPEFPIRLAASCTVYKAQGATFNSISVVKMKSHGIHPESLYVAVSRERSVDSLYLLENISDEYIFYFGRGPSNLLYKE